MKINIRHHTEYHYETETGNSIQYLRVTPQTLAHQRVLEWVLTLPKLSAEIFDGFGNYCTILTLNEPHQDLCIDARGCIEIDDKADSIDDNRIPPLVLLNHTELTRCTPELAEFAEMYSQGRADRDGLTALSAAILQKMPYTYGSTKVETTAQQAFTMGVGVCQDHTHVFLTCARHLGVPARYVSGYLVTDDASHLSTHAWAEAYLDGKWYLFDTTNQLFRPSDHIQLAVGRDYLDTAPVRGVRSGGGTECLSYHVSVENINEQRMAGAQ